MNAVVAQEFSPAPRPAVLPDKVIVESITLAGDWTRARADAYRTYQEGNLIYAEARKSLAEAISMDLDNYIKYAETYYNRRIAAERKKMELLDVLEERRDKRIDYRKHARQRLLNVLLTDRERQRHAISSGTTLNKLLFALAETPVAYGVELGPSIGQQVDSRLSLSPTLFDHLQVVSPGSTRQTFRLTQQSGINLDWWPDHLRAQEFDLPRERLTKAIEKANDSVGQQAQVDRDSLSELREAHAFMSQRYYQAYPASRKKAMNTDELRQYIRTEDFLIRLNDDIQRIRDTGRMETMGHSRPFDINRDGINAQTLATWMLQNGVTFAKARPGDEGFYVQLFSKLADLYAMVGE